MRLSRIFLVLVPLALPACVSVNHDTSPTPSNATVVVPPSNTPTVVCANGGVPPCN